MTEWACDESGCEMNCAESFAAAMDEGQAHVDETGHSVTVNQGISILSSF